MKKSILIILCFFSVAAFAQKKSSGRAVAMLMPTKVDTNATGKITFRQKGEEVTMKLKISIPNRANQTVAAHIHEHPDCSNMGNNTHGHWNPTNSQHGKWGEGNFHLGDIGNIQLNKKGKGSLTITTKLWSVGTGKTNDVVGHGFIVHSGTDDYVSQPAGKAGTRISCGVIEAQ